jgi:hypothetical protein
MLMNPAGLLPMLSKSSSELVLTYTFPQFVCLLFILGVFAFLFFSDDSVDSGS